MTANPAATKARRLFTIPPGVPFLKTVADALCEGRLVPSFRHDPADPLMLARATIFVPTRRAARALRSEFVDRLAGGSAILPVIRPLGEIDDDAGFFESDAPAALTLDPPVETTERLLELARLIVAWKAALPEAVRAVHADTPLVAPATPADAIWLARGLADLLDSMETEGRPWAALETLEAADHAAWWQLTLEFLRIVTEFWPDRLAELGRTSPAAHRDTLLRAEAQRLRSAPPDGPVVVAGSTGSLSATADLIASVMALDAGAVILPGLDRMMDAAHWPLVARPPEPAQADDPALCAHPQYGLYRLLERLECTREDAAALGEPPPRLAARNRLVSLAMLPAAATPAWAEVDSIDDAAAGMDGVTLLEAANEREEAVALAAAMRLALGGEGETRQVALVSPDRTLARRVVAELRRFGIEADDSGGTPLAVTAPATLMTLAVEVATNPGDPVALLALLKHPLARFGMPAGQMREAAHGLEIVALRAGPGETDAAELSDLVCRRLAASKTDHHPAEWRQRIGEDRIAQAQELAERVETALSPLTGRHFRRREPPATGVSTEVPIAVWAGDTARVLEAVAADDTGDLAPLWSGEAGEALADLLSAIMESRSSLDARVTEWAGMLPALLAGRMVKPRGGGHPRAFVWGALEARLQHVDTLVLAGLNEGTWPGGAADDPFLSRGMKMAIGLEPPERRIGQAAHDFVMGLGAGNVVLSRAARSGTAPTVASRWLQRLLAVAGEDAVAPARRRGQDLVGWAAELDAAPSRPAAMRPEPRPPRQTQPPRYSFSEVKTLRRDPYAIYARRILRLDPMADLALDPSLADRGTLYHAVLETFVRTCTQQAIDPAHPDAPDLLKAITRDLFETANLPPHVAATWRPRFERVAGLFLDWERGRNDRVTARHVEARARMDVEPVGVALGGMADRIDLMRDGTAEIIDYKTGGSPSPKQARVLLDPQLALEAGVLMRAGFGEIPPTTPSSLLYVRLKPEVRLKVEAVDNKASGKPESRSAEELGTESLAQFTRLVAVLADGSRGFASRIIPASARDFGGEYDHLARVAEWASADGDDETSGDG